MKSNDHKIYILKSYGIDNKIIYKLGYSLNPIKRVKEYTLLNPFIELVATLDIIEPKLWEKLFHKRNKSSFANEWYNLEALQEAFLCKEMHCLGYIKYNDSEIFEKLDELQNKSKIFKEEDLLDLTANIRKFNKNTIKIELECQKE